MTDHDPARPPDHHDREKCIRLAERLSEYLDGELPESMCRLVEDHFRDCSECERFLVSLRRTRDCAKLIPRLELSAEKLAELAGTARRRLEAGEGTDGPGVNGEPG